MGRNILMLNGSLRKVQNTITLTADIIILASDMTSREGVRKYRNADT